MALHWMGNVINGASLMNLRYENRAMESDRDC